MTAVPHPSREVARTFLKLGLTSFGGPVAHLAYFRDELVLRRAWLKESDYADLVALCQFLPGPASSQVGFALGLARAGPWGGLAAWTAFTLPSALLLILFAHWAPLLAGSAAQGAVAGLRIVAVAIVAQAVWGMAKALCPDKARTAIALLAVLLVAGLGGTFSQVLAIGMGAALGLAVCRGRGAGMPGQLRFGGSKTAGVLALSLFVILLAVLPIAAHGLSWGGLAVFDAFYRAGALVFGGGHVVLPLLEAEVVGRAWMGKGEFMAGYGAAQAVPGPLFTFAAYLGYAQDVHPNGLSGSAIALLAIFAPGLLLLVGIMPFWDALRKRQAAQAAMRGTNAAVVGILGAALYDPVITTGISGPPDFALALGCFLLLTVWRVPPWAVVILAAMGGMVLAPF